MNNENIINGILVLNANTEGYLKDLARFTEFNNNQLMEINSNLEDINKSLNLLNNTLWEIFNHMQSQHN